MASWPAAPACPPPCLNEKIDCPFPTALAISITLANVEINFPAGLVIIGGSFAELLTPGGHFVVAQYLGVRNEAEEFVGAALALLALNIDLVEWVVCLAYSWNPRVPSADVQRRVTKVLKLLTGQDIWVTRQGAWAPTGVFIVEEWIGDGNTGWATTSDLYPLYSNRQGMILPLGLGVYKEGMANYQARNVKGLCALAWVAETLIHEAIHIVSDAIQPALGVLADPFQDVLPEASDKLMSWAPQNMAGISFLWALAQRYPCLRDVACCPKTADEFFMTSEPDFAHEVAPWDWVDTAACPV